MIHLPPDQPRAFGIETEYGLHPQPFAIAAADLAKALPPYLHNTPGNFNEYGRIYPDQSKNLEVCTPEVYTLQGALSAHFAGEELAREIAGRLFGGKVSAQKRSIDAAMQSRGEHDNMTVGEAFNLHDCTKLLGHLATRIVFTGPGSVVFQYRPDVDTAPHDFRYTIDQRALVTAGDPINCGSTMPQKPFMKTFSENFDVSCGTKRLQIVSPSQNRFAYPVAARLFNTSSVARLIEQGRYPKRLILADPAGAIGSIARDPTLRYRALLADGRTRYTALQFQEKLMGAVLKLRDLPDDELYMAELTSSILHDFMAGRFDPWTGHVEWLAKLDRIRRSAYRRGQDELNVHSARIDLDWHALQKDGYVEKLRQCGRVAMYPKQDDIDAAKRFPPDPTRAQMRSAAIRDAFARGRSMSTMNWHYWQASDEIKALQMNDVWGNGPAQRVGILD